ncbi:MAG TPA: hypothetical protein VKF63_03410 [Terracidiphilus sp.]|nr:hypothetical protein [Terracidiphilus sp.]
MPFECLEGPLQMHAAGAFHQRHIAFTQILPEPAASASARPASACSAAPQ